MFKFYFYILILCPVILIKAHLITDNESDAPEEFESDLVDISENDDVVDDLLRKRRSSNFESFDDIDAFKCKTTNKKSCCGKSNVFKHFGESNKTIAKECFEEVMGKLKPEMEKAKLDNNLFSCEKFKIAKKVQFCSTECIGKRSQMLTEDGNLNKDYITNYLTTEKFKADWQKKIGDKALKKCLEEKYVEWPTNENGLKCNPVAVQFQHCLWKEYETNCPEEQQSKKKSCEKLRRNLLDRRSSIPK